MASECDCRAADGKKAGTNPCFLAEWAKPAVCPASSRFAYFLGCRGLVLCGTLSAQQPSCRRPSCRPPPSCRQPPCRPPPSCRRPSYRQRPSCRRPSFRPPPSCRRPSYRRPPSSCPPGHVLCGCSHRGSGGRRGAAAGAIALAGGVAGGGGGGRLRGGGRRERGGNHCNDKLVHLCSLSGQVVGRATLKIEKPCNYRHLRVVLQFGRAAWAAPAGHPSTNLVGWLAGCGSSGFFFLADFLSVGLSPFTASCRVG